MSIISLIAVSTVGGVQSQPLIVKPVRTLSDARAIALAPAPSGDLFAASLETNVIRIIDAGSRKTVKELEGHPQNAYGLAWSSDGAYLASGDESARVFVWDTRTWKTTRQYRAHQRGIQNLDFNNSRTLLLSTGKDDMVNIYNLMSDAKGATHKVPGEGANFYGARFIGKTSNFGVGILSYGAREYSGSSGKLLGFFPSKQSVQAVDYTPDGALMAAGGRDGLVTVWLADKRKRIATLRGHNGWIFDIKFSPNGKYVATSSDDRTVRIWEPKTGKQVAQLDNQASFGSPIAWTADGRYLVTVSVGEVVQISTVTPHQPTPPEKPVKKK